MRAPRATARESAASTADASAAPGPPTFEPTDRLRALFREVAKRVKSRTKGQALQALHESTPIELPRALVEMETQNMVQQARADLEAPSP